MSTNQKNSGPLSMGKMILYGIASFLLPLIGFIGGLSLLFAKDRRTQGVFLLALGLAGALMYTAVMRQEDGVTAVDSPPPSRPAPSVADAKEEIESRIKEEVSSILDLGTTREEWNLQDPEFETNGNSDLAVSLLTTGTETPIGGSVDLGAVIKTPWEFYGKIYCAEGIVTFVEDYPPGSEMSEWLGDGTSSQITLMADHGVGSFYMTSGSGDLRVGHYAHLCGFPVGRGEVETSAGGNVASAVFIGSGIEADSSSFEERSEATVEEPITSPVDYSAPDGDSREEVERIFPQIINWVRYLPRVPGCDVANGQCVLTMWDFVSDMELTPAQVQIVRDACQINVSRQEIGWREAACALRKAEELGLAVDFINHTNME